MQLFYLPASFKIITEKQPQLVIHFTEIHFFLFYFKVNHTGNLLAAFRKNNCEIPHGPMYKHVMRRFLMVNMYKVKRKKKCHL